ncbi:MAG: magnesium/cobalt transporter CorA [bacterium]
MPRFFKKVIKKTGLAPGTLVYTNEQKMGKAKITVIDYNEEKLEEREVNKIEECFPLKKTSTVSWINIDGLHEVEIIEKIGKEFGIHPLVLEDILNTTQRPKYEDFEQYLYIVLKMLTFDDTERIIKAEQVSIIVGPHFLLSFQEKEGDIFMSLRDRIRNAKGRIRKMGTDYLAYALLDAIVDHYFIILEKIGEEIEDMEDLLLANPTHEIVHTIHRLRQEIIFLRKSVWPLREVISALAREELPMIHETTGVYLRDVYDHTIQVIDTVETFRDLISGMLDIYLSSISNKMNNVMKVLTIIATIFIPLTFIAGIYGMNFKYMPELEWRWGYPAVWIVMGGIFIAMLIYFKRKEWI